MRELWVMRGIDMEPGVIREGRWRIGIGIGRVAVMPTASFSAGLGLGLALLSNLERVLIAASAMAVVTPATARRRVVGGRERGRRGRHHKLASDSRQFFISFSLTSSVMSISCFSIMQCNNIFKKNTLIQISKWAKRT